MKLPLLAGSLVMCIIWITYFSLPSNNLKIIACDVGQGDAILIIQNQNQILIDGGPDKSVISCLSKHMPFWDRKIELVVLTHPEADHATGLIEVFERYDVDSFLASEVDNSTETYKVLKNTVGGGGSVVRNPDEGMKMRLGLISLDILNGWQDDSGSQNVLGAVEPIMNRNDYSIVISLKFGDFDALFTGDISPQISDKLASSGRVKNVEYIKVPHHGSKNGLTENLLRVSDPEVAVISVGDKNHFGHPHQEILDILQNRNIEILRTDEIGDVVVESDGKRFWVNNLIK